MENRISRAYCLRHPGEVIGHFGIVSFLRMMLGRDPDLLSVLVDRHRHHGIALPGQPGSAYRISAIIEFRVARIYGKLADHFADQPVVQAFFHELQNEEKQHGHLMLFCMYTIHNHPPLKFVPTIKEPAIRRLLDRLKRVETLIPTLTLNEALAITAELEASEINTIFEHLLAQANHPSTQFFRMRFEAMEGHATGIPRRIEALRMAIGRQTH